MREIKTIVIDENGNIVNVGALENIPDGWKIEEREMIYTKEYGWQDVDWKPPLTENELLTEYVVDVDFRVTMLELGLI